MDRTTPPQHARARSTERLSFYLWTALALAIAVTVVVFSWHATGGTSDPTNLPTGDRLSHATVVIDSAILVFREGLETILVLAAITASFLGANRVYRRPVAPGGGTAIAPGIATWFAVVWLIGQFHGSEFDVQAATGLPALLVLLLVMNWFFHRIYWTGWISNHHRRRRSLLGDDPESNLRRDAARPRDPRLHVGLPRVLRDRDLPAEPARALRLERGARGCRDRRALSPPPPAS